MKIAVFGGTGKTGQHIVRQALQAGHDVVALARNPAKFSSRHEKLTVIEGDIANADRVDETIQGVEAVISVLGPRSNKPEFAISKGTDHILAAMKRHNVRRIIISAGAGVREPEDKPRLIDRFFGVLLKVFSRHVVADMEQAVAKIKASDRDWTVVRVPMLTDQPAQATLIVGYVGDIRPRIARENMAAFMLKQLNDAGFVRKAPAISN